MLLVAPLLTSLLLGAGDPPGENTWVVSLTDQGQYANDGSGWGLSASRDGRFLLFGSKATDFLPNDTNGELDIFRKDRLTGALELVAETPSGVSGNGATLSSDITPCGRYVAFSSGASDLVPGDTNGQWDVFVRDFQTGQTELVSVSSAGGQGNAESSYPVISANGMTVAFVSWANNLVDGDTNRVIDIFVFDRLTRQLERVSVNDQGQQGNQSAFRPFMDDEGRFVGFRSGSTNLVQGDNNGVWDVFVHDRYSRTTRRVSVSTSGGEGDRDADVGQISGDGRVVVFQTGSNLVPEDSGWSADVYAHTLATGVTQLVTADDSGVPFGGIAPKITQDGNTVAFLGRDDRLDDSVKYYRHVITKDLSNGEYRVRDLDEAGKPVADDTELADISPDGRCVVFASDSSDYVAGDPGGTDVFVRGPWLTLDAPTRVVPVGANVRLTTWTGDRGAPALLYVTALDGTRVLLNVARGQFGATGLWAVTGTVPPELAGTDVAFQAFGIAPNGSIEATDEKMVSFR